MPPNGHAMNVVSLSSAAGIAGVITVILSCKNGSPIGLKLSLLVNMRVLP